MKKLFRIVYYILIHVAKLQNRKPILTTIPTVQQPEITWTPIGWPFQTIAKFSRKEPTKASQN